MATRAHHRRLPGAAIGTATPVDVSLLGPAHQVDAVKIAAVAAGSGAVPGSVGRPSDRRPGRPLGDGGEPTRTAVVGSGLACGPTRRPRHPEGGGTAVGEDDLIAVGKREELGQTLADRPHDVLHRRLTVAGAEHQTPVSTTTATARPDLGRAAASPSAGSRSAGMVICASRSCEHQSWCWRMMVAGPRAIVGGARSTGGTEDGRRDRGPLVKSSVRSRPLDGLDLTVAAGEVAGFLGPNGGEVDDDPRASRMYRSSGGTARVFGRSVRRRRRNPTPAGVRAR